MLNQTVQPFRIVILLVVGLLASCSSSTVDAPPEDVVEPGNQIGAMVLRNISDESEARPMLPELCGWMELAELSEEKTEECVIAYEPTIFLGSGMMEPDPEKRNEYWENMTWEVSINGQPLDLEAFGTIDALGGRWWNVLLENPTSVQLQIVTVLTVHEDPVEMLGNTLDLTVGAADEAELRQEEYPVLPASGVDAGQHAFHSNKANLDYLLFVRLTISRILSNSGR